MQSARKQRIGGFGRCAPWLRVQLIGAKFLQSHRDQNKDCARSQADQPQATTIRFDAPHITIVEEHIGSADKGLIVSKNASPVLAFFYCCPLALLALLFLIKIL